MLLTPYWLKFLVFKRIYLSRQEIKVHFGDKTLNVFIIILELCFETNQVLMSTKVQKVHIYFVTSGFSRALEMK